MRVEMSRISKGNICRYLGREIPNWQALGLEPEKTYRLFRDPKELQSSTRQIDGKQTRCGAWSWDGKPLLIHHVAIDADEPARELWVGSVGTCTWEEPYVVTRPLMVLTSEAIKLIEGRDPQGRPQHRELSSSYRYDAVMEPGAWGGQQYDGRMVNIRGNHVAIVKEGRAGPDVHVADEAPPEFRRMKTALQIAIATAIRPYLGADADTRGIAVALDAVAKELGEVPNVSVISLDAKEEEEAEDEARDRACDARGEDAEPTEEEREEAMERARDRKRRRAADAREEACDSREEAMDAAEEANDKGHEEEAEAKDRKKARDARAKDRAMRAKDREKSAKDAARRAAGKIKGGDSRRRGKDAMPDPKDHRRDFRSGDSVTKDEMNAAVQAAVDKERAQQRAANQARVAVRPLVGDVAMDSAEEIYRFALKTHTGKEPKTKDVDALAELVDMAVQNKGRTPAAPGGGIAYDAAAVAGSDLRQLFPNAAN